MHTYIHAHTRTTYAIQPKLILAVSVLLLLFLLLLLFSFPPATNVATPLKNMVPRSYSGGNAYIHAYVHTYTHSCTHMYIYIQTYKMYK